MSRVLLITKKPCKYKDFIVDLLENGILINILDAYVDSLIIKLSEMKYDLIIMEDNPDARNMLNTVKLLGRVKHNTSIVFISVNNLKDMPKNITETVSEITFLNHYRRVLGTYGIVFKNYMLKKKIVIVDDDTISLEILSNIIEGSDYSVEGFSNGIDVLDSLSKESSNKEEVSLIILDLMMPVIDGFELLKYIREIDEYKETPVLIASGRRDPESIEKIAKYNIDGYILKPYNSDLIIKKIRESIG